MMIILMTNRSTGISNVQCWWQWREAGQVIKSGWKRMQELQSNGTLYINTRCILAWEMAFWPAQSPRYNTERASLPSWRKQHGWRTPSSDLSTTFALTSKSLWDISDPNLATIKSRLTFENKQEYNTRWDTCKLPAFFSVLVNSFSNWQSAWAIILYQVTLVTDYR